ncbi:MAG: hypothetical protein O7F76_08860, partial [Planctomycetota bacterium]|nr:hypothetical protein [Planctomycetota bacterium]
MNRIVFSAAFGLSLPLHLAAQTVQIVTDLPGSFIDITGTGEQLMLADDAVAVRTTTIGNIVYPTGAVVIGNNGGVGFGNVPNENLPPLNEPIPSSSAFGGGQAMLAFWDDIDDKCGDV